MSNQRNSNLAGRGSRARNYNHRLLKTNHLSIKIQRLQVIPSSLRVATSALKSSLNFADKRYDQLEKPSLATGRYMCWTGIILGTILGTIAGVCIGVMVAGRLSAAKRRETEEHSRETPIDLALLDEAEEVPDELSPLPKPETYFDRYPHS